MKTKVIIILVGFSLTLFGQKVKESDLTEAIAQRRASQVMVFKKLYIFPAKAEKDKLLGNLIFDATREKLVSLKRFKIFYDTTLSAELLKVGLTDVDIKNKEALYKMADTLDLNAFIEPVIYRRKARIDIEMKFLDKKGVLFASAGVDDFTYKDNKQLKKVISGLVEDLIKKIPYAGLITSIKRKLFFLDVGKKDNFKQNDVYG